ncbi:hypothetical protein Tco_0629349 [Tanacetum coccineum]|uniref:Uncharacterized protein n=1 Tax=Tanacetum coccineum TaxID=301880 RepID=A0ABQ4WT06_9ASTR
MQTSYSTRLKVHYLPDTNGKSAGKPITPQYESVYEVPVDLNKLRGTRMQKNWHSLPKKKQASGSASRLGYNALTERDMGICKGMQEANRLKTSVSHKEKMMMCKTSEKRFSLQADWLEDTDMKRLMNRNWMHIYSFRQRFRSLTRRIQF